MEVNNRFDLLASLSVDEESIESSFININPPPPPPQEQEQQINDEHLTKNYWEIPEYVEKSIPSSFPFITIVETSKHVTKSKKSQHVKKVKPVVNSPTYEEQQDEVEVPPTTEVQNQPSTHSYYPPQPYKFKQTSANHRNETIPKFNRKNNVLPKHTSARGNSKSCTHQI